MLCKRPTRKIEDSVREMGGHEFFIEEKLDGERMQLHKRGNEYFYCSRYAFPFSRERWHLFNAGRERITLTYMGSMWEQEAWLLILSTPLIRASMSSSTITYPKFYSFVFQHHTWRWDARVGSSFWAQFAVWNLEDCGFGYVWPIFTFCVLMLCRQIKEGIEPSPLL